MSERASWRECEPHNLFATELGGRATVMALVRPLGVSSGVVLPIFSGLASGPELHLPVAKKLSEHGHTVALVWQEGSSPHAIRGAKYVMTSLVQGSFGKRQIEGLPRDRKVRPLGHSHGFSTVTGALEEMYEAKDTDIDGAIAQVPACMGGVRKSTAILDAAISVAEELHHVRISGAIEHRRVAIEAGNSVRALGAEVVNEVNHARAATVVPQVQQLKEADVKFVAVDHPHDRLVSSAKNQETYRQLDIPYIEVEAPFAGHNVQLYYPHQTARAIHEAQAVLLDGHNLAA